MYLAHIELESVIIIISIISIIIIIIISTVNVLYNDALLTDNLGITT